MSVSVGKHVLFELSISVASFGTFGLIGNIVPLGTCRLYGVLGKGSGDEGGDDTPSALSSMDQRVTHEMNTADPSQGTRSDAWLQYKSSTNPTPCAWSVASYASADYSKGNQ